MVCVSRAAAHRLATPIVPNNDGQGLEELDYMDLARIKRSHTADRQLCTSAASTHCPAQPCRQPRLVGVRVEELSVMRRWRSAATGVGIVALWCFALSVLVPGVIVPVWCQKGWNMQGRIAAALGLSGMALWCVTAVVTRPSYHDSREPLPGTITIKRSNGRPRWCSKCSAPKPDRCHHCRQCGRCVLKMDHHCPWLLDTCIGLRNYKAFVLFLLYTSLFCVLCLDTLVRACLALWSDDPEVVVEIPLLWIALFALTLLVRHVRLHSFPSL